MAGTITTLKGTMDALDAVARGPVAAALKDATGATPQVTRVQPRTPNVPAIWHERRPSAVVAPDVDNVRDVLVLAVVLAVRHGEQDRESLPLETAIDQARVIYDTECRGPYPLGGVHRARRINLEPPTPTEIGGVALLTSAVVLRVEIEHRPPRRP